jgi:hypothetical protein
LRVKVVKGRPSSIFHILAEPSVDVEAKNSESRLDDEQRRHKYSVSRPAISPTLSKLFSVWVGGEGEPFQISNPINSSLRKKYK